MSELYLDFRGRVNLDLQRTFWGHSKKYLWDIFLSMVTKRARIVSIKNSIKML